MEKLLVLLCVLVLVSLGSGKSRAPCPNTSCPEYEIKEEHQGFQKRSYEKTMWLTTNIESKSPNHVLEASNRLDQFCRNNSIDLRSSWPALITVNSNGKYSMSWFVPSELNVSKQQGNSQVHIQNEGPFEVYVSSFDGLPSLESGQQNAEGLWENLKAHLDKNCAIPTFSGTTYSSYLSLVHNNEIWIRVNDIC